MERAWQSLIILIVIFTLSFVGAVILFSVLESYAEVVNPSYRLGGAAAGFVVFFLILFAAFSRLAARPASEVAGQARKAITDEPLDPSQLVEKNALEYKDIPRAIELLAEKIRLKHPDIILGVDMGGAIVGGALAKYLRIPIRLLHRTKSKEICSDFDASEVNGKIVVLVDDASRTGRTIEKAKRYVNKHFSPQDLIVAVVLVTKTKYRIHKETTPLELVNCYVYLTSRTDVKMPWDMGNGVEERA